MRESMMRIKKIMAGVLAAALVAAGTPVYANVSEDSIAVDEVEDSAVSADEAVDEIITEEAVSEDATPDESLSEDAVTEDVPTYVLDYRVLGDGTLEITRYTGEAKGDLIIPDTIDGKKVTRIGDYAFFPCNGFTGDLVIPDSVTTIGQYAFSGCTGFNGKLVLSESLKTIEQYAFDCCYGFTGDLVIPDSVMTIGDSAFALCYGFDGDLVIPGSVTTIGDFAFQGCWGFTGNLIISDGVKTIGSDAFQGCTGFTGNLVIPDGVTTIVKQAFSGCTGFTGNLVIPDSVTTIGTGAFSYLGSTRMVTNRSGVSIPLSSIDADDKSLTWTDAATGATITEIANGTAIRSDAYDLSNEDNFTHSIVPDAVYTGKKIMPDITVYHGMNTLRKNKDYKITFSNNINAGTATFTITGKGLYKGTATDTFNILEKDITDDDVKISEIPMVRENGKTYTPVPTITYNKKKLKKGIDFTVKYYTDKACTGASVTPSAAGKYYVKIRGINNFKGIIEGINNSKGRDEADFEITPAAKVPVRNLAVAKIPAQKYTGAEVKPALTVKYGKTLLKEGEHYEVTYENNIEAGTATAVITGIRKKGYTGVRRVNFRIAGGSISKAVYEGFKTSFVYDGSEKKQDGLKLYKDKSKAETARLKGILLAEYDALGDEKTGYDYVYSYEKNTDAGKAVMTIKGVNGWSGTVKKTYTIKPYNIKTNEGGNVSISLEPVSQPYTGVAIKPEPMVTYGDSVLTKGSDYTLSYANNVAVNDGTGKKKPVIKVTGKGNFSGTDASTTFVIMKPTMADAHLSVVTGGSVSSNKKGNWKAKVDVITPNGKKLKQGKDYTVRYTMDDAGETLADSNAALPAGTTIYVHVAAKPGASYTGGLKSSYEIKKYDITKLTAVVSPKVYTGKEVKVKDSDITWKSGKTVVKDVTFVLDNTSYLNNTNPGTASVRVKGKDDYSGTKTVTYRIATRKILWWWV